MALRGTAQEISTSGDSPRQLRLRSASALALGVVLVASGCSALASGPVADAVPSPSLITPTAPAVDTPSESPTPTDPDTDPATTPDPTFVGVIDGDTIKTSAGTIRIIGIDTPELGQCGYREAAATVSELFTVGDPVTLERPNRQNDHDRYNRLIRYVGTADGVDLGLAQLAAGHAVARYDSTDGYPKHPRESAYHAAQLATLSDTKTVTTPACAASDPDQESAEDPTAPITPGNPADPTAAWWTEYPSCAALKRGTSGHSTGPFNRDDPSQAAAYEWFAFGTGNRGDGDGDGLACE